MLVRIRLRLVAPLLFRLQVVPLPVPSQELVEGLPSKVVFSTSEL